MASKSCEIRWHCHFEERLFATRNLIGYVTVKISSLRGQALETALVEMTMPPRPKILFTTYLALSYDLTPS